MWRLTFTVLVLCALCAPSSALAICFGDDCVEGASGASTSASGAFDSGDYSGAISLAIAEDATLAARPTDFTGLAKDPERARRVFVVAASTIRIGAKEVTPGKKSAGGAKDSAANMAWAVSVMRYFHGKEGENITYSSLLAEGLYQNKKTREEGKRLLLELVARDVPLDAHTWVAIASLYEAEGEAEKQKQAQRSCLEVARDGSICGVSNEQVSGFSIESSTSKIKTSTGITVESGTDTKKSKEAAEPAVNSDGGGEGISVF